MKVIIITPALLNWFQLSSTIVSGL